MQIGVGWLEEEENPVLDRQPGVVDSPITFRPSSQHRARLFDASSQPKATSNNKEPKAPHSHAYRRLPWCCLLSWFLGLPRLPYFVASEIKKGASRNFMEAGLGEEIIECRTARCLVLLFNSQPLHLWLCTAHRVMRVVIHEMVGHKDRQKRATSKATKPLVLDFWLLICE